MLHLTNCYKPGFCIYKYGGRQVAQNANFYIMLLYNVILLIYKISERGMFYFLCQYIDVTLGLTW